MLPRNQIDPLFKSDDVARSVLSAGPCWINVWSHQRDPSWIRTGTPWPSRRDAAERALGRISYRVKATAKPRGDA